MKVEYTKLDGNVVVFTSNTKIYDTHYLGNSVPGLTSPEITARFEAIPGVMIKVTPSTRFPEKLMTNYFVFTESYITDYGLHIWAKERLSESEYHTFTAQVDGSTITSTPTNQSMDFMRWWKRFISDPNVKFTE